MGCIYYLVSTFGFEHSFVKFEMYYCMCIYLRFIISAARDCENYPCNRHHLFVVLCVFWGENLYLYCT